MCVAIQTEAFKFCPKANTLEIGFFYISSKPFSIFPRRNALNIGLMTERRWSLAEWGLNLTVKHLLEIFLSENSLSRHNNHRSVAFSREVSRLQVNCYNTLHTYTVVQGFASLSNWKRFYQKKQLVFTVKITKIFYQSMLAKFFFHALFQQSFFILRTGCMHC